MHPKKEKTFVIFKPDSVQRGLIGEIIHRFERVGLKIVAMKMVLATEDQCWQHYNKDEAWYIKTGNRIIENRKAQNKPIEKEAVEYGKDVVKGLVKYMTCSPVVVMILEGNSSRAVVKRLVGGTEPITADTGTIRGDLTLDSYYLCDADDGRAVRNLIHCTDPADGEGEAQREISVWFKEEEIVKWISINEKMLYDVDLDGHLE
ncbi:MAG TPA: nucleoside-diphosphate kinase [Candidatus Paceibacterota bacterium]|nr:nucleoside-diphosphate kinase [Candidatus Paceibacterota bacterium]HQB56965.1 nucleoside-diphosphate kinase [Candidatus Paceibacterota bacterium]